MYWTVPPMWTGRTVAVLASGPSMSQAVADSVRHLPRIAVNTTFRLAPDAEIIYGCDGRWWREHPEALACPGLKVTIEVLPKHRPNAPAEVLVLRNTGREGFDPDPTALRTLNNGGGQGAQIAVHAGAARILLLGFDMHGGHWHGPHPEGLANPGPVQMAQWIERLNTIAPILAARGVDVVNCTDGSALRCFRQSTVAAELAERLAA